MDRRRFLMSGAALGCSVAASPFVTPVAMAAAMELALAIGTGRACGLDHHPLRNAWPAVEPRLSSRYGAST